jgi:hypothetical protein
MLTQVQQQEAVWREDSAIWELIAGELVMQSSNPLSKDLLALARRAHQGAVDATTLLEKDQKDDAGHALIGVAVALGLGARNETAAGTPIEDFGADLAAAISWESKDPTPEELAALATELGKRTGGGWGQSSPTPWELAVRAGAHAAGLSRHITRRRQRRDMLEVAEAPGDAPPA